MTRRRPPPMYVKPPMVPATAENVRAVFDRLREPVPLGRVLDEQSKMLRVFLRREGLRVTKRLPPMRLDVASRTVDGGFVVYRESELHPAAIEAIEALAAILRVRRAEGALQVLAAMSLGAAIERAKASARWAGVLDAYRRGRRRSPLTDEQIRAVSASYAKQVDAAAKLGVGPRQLRNHWRRLGIKKRKSVRRPPRKK